MKCLRYRKILLAALGLATALFAGPVPAARAAEQVEVTLPFFPVTLGDQTLDTQGEEYPFLLYRDITYLPLTYYGCRLLGLYEKWTPQGGLVISDVGVPGDYRPTPAVSDNTAPLYASVAEGKITVMGRSVENDGEAWPYLVFRDVTYLPMTWANMYELLGCDYRFDPGSGLHIARAALSDAGGSAVYLPLSRTEEGTLIGAVAAWKGYFWFTDTAGWISRVPMGGGEPEQLFALPRNYMFGDFPVLAGLTVREDGLVLSYHIGGGIMGHDESYRFNPDGSYITLSDRSAAVWDYADLRVLVNQNQMPFPGNLSVSRDGGETYTALGSENYIYGWAYSVTPDGGSGGSQDRELVRAGDSLYLLGCDVGDSPGRPMEPGETLPARFSAVCRVDLGTGETVPVTGPARRFRIVAGTLWYISFDGELHHCALDGSGDEVLLFSAGVQDFFVDGETVYMITTRGSGRHISINRGGTGEVKTWEGAEVVSMSLQDGFLIALFADDGSGAGVRLRVYREGQEIYSLSGVDLLCAGVSEGKLYYVLE